MRSSQFSTETKLAVIVHADIIGSTGLVRRDEHMAHARMRDAFERLSKKVRHYGGAVREVRGDALVADFDRASDALCAALGFQQLHREFNSSITDSIKAQVRIGIALGEVIVADNTVTGEGVILAQRVEQLAPANGVCVEQAVERAVPSSLGVSFEKLGPQNLKGFDESIHASLVSLPDNVALPDPGRRVIKRKARRLGGLAAGLFTIVLLTVLGWWLWQLNQKTSASATAVSAEQTTPIEAPNKILRLWGADDWQSFANAVAATSYAEAFESAGGRFPLPQLLLEFAHSDKDEFERLKNSLGDAQRSAYRDKDSAGAQVMGAFLRCGADGACGRILDVDPLANTGAREFKPDLYRPWSGGRGKINWSEMKYFPVSQNRMEVTAEGWDADRGAWFQRGIVNTGGSGGPMKDGEYDYYLEFFHPCTMVGKQSGRTMYGHCD